MIETPEASLGTSLTNTTKTTKDSVAITSASTGVLVFLVLLYSLLGHRFVIKSKYFTEGSAASALGLLTGLTLLVVFNHYNGLLNQLLVFNSASFFTYLLPPVIFYCGISVEKKQFFKNLPSILLFGIFGTFLSFTIIACFLYGFSKLQMFTLEDCFALGAIFAATDSVAVLQVLDQGRMPLLFSLAFGEGVINDATSVVLLGAVNKIFPGDDHTSRLSWGVAAGILGQFAYLFITSFALGAASGLGIAFLLKRFQGGWQGPHQEVAIIGLLAYLSYLLAEVLGLSGILSLFCCGIAVSQYALFSVSPAGRITVDNVFRTLSYLSEGLIFIYVGLDALDPLMWRNSYAIEALWLFIMLVLLLAVSRAATVIPLALVHNWWSKDTLGTRDMVIVWWSGMIRGAVSVALVYHHFDKSTTHSADRHRSTLIVTTLMVVLFTILGYGAITKPLMQLMLGEKNKPIMEQLKTLGNGRAVDGLLHYIRDYQGDDLNTALNHDGHYRSSDCEEEQSRLLHHAPSAEMVQLPCSKAAGHGSPGNGYHLDEGVGARGAAGSRDVQLNIDARYARNRDEQQQGQAQAQQQQATTQVQQWNLQVMSNISTMWREFDRRYMLPLFGGYEEEPHAPRQLVGPGARAAGGRAQQVVHARRGM